MFEEDRWLHPHKTPPIFTTSLLFLVFRPKLSALHTFINLERNILSTPTTPFSSLPKSIACRFRLSLRLYLRCPRPRYFPALDVPLIDQSRELAIRVIEPIDIGYHHKSQVAVVEINAPVHRGKKLVLRAFDPSYLCPDDLLVVDLRKERISEGSAGDSQKDDLSGSTTTLVTDSPPPSLLGWKKEAISQGTRRSSSSVPHLSRIDVLIAF